MADIRSLSGTIYASRDSLWWRGARVAFPSTKLSGDGTIGFGKSPIRIDVVAAPLGIADLRWLSPRLPAQGGGTLRYTMRVHGDSAEYAVRDANVRYRGATIAGDVAATRVRLGKRSELAISSADVDVTRLTTDIIREFAPSVKLRRRGTLDGHVAVSGTTRALQLDADVRFDDAVAGRSHLKARGGLGFDHGVQTRDLAVQMLPLQIATLGGGSGARLPVRGVLNGSATVSGGARDGWSVRGDVTHLDRGERSRVVGSGSYRPASKRIVAEAQLRPLSLATAGRFAPAAQLRGSVTGRVRAAGTTKALRFQGVLRSTAGGGAIDARGSVAVAGSRSRYDVSAALDALDARAFSRRAPSTRLTGTVTARGRGLAPATADAVVSADLVRSRYDTLAVQQLTARLAASGGLLRVDTLALLASGARASAVGSVGLVSSRSGTLRFAAVVDSLGTLRRWIGTADSGSVAAPVARQRALLMAARADSARRADAVRIEQLALGLEPGVAIAVDTLPRVRRDSLSGQLEASGTLRGNIKELGLDASVRGSRLVVRGSTVRSVAGTVSSSNVRRRSAPLAFSVSADSIVATGRAFDQVRANGSWRDRILAADLRVRQDSLVSYAAAGRYARPASGGQLVQLDSLRGVFDTLVWRLAHPAGLRFAGGGVSVDSVDLRSSVGGRVFVNGVLPREGPVRLDVAAEGVRVSTVLQALQRDGRGDGIVAARARIDGMRSAPVIAGAASLREARYGDERAPDADVEYTYRDRRLTATATARDSTGRRVLTADASLPLNLALESVKGSRRMDGALSANVQLDSLDMATLPLKTRALDDLRGKTAADVQVRGSWRSPAYAGRAAVREGGLTLVSTGMRVDGAVADLLLQGDTLRLDSLVARVGGPMRVTGTVEGVRGARRLVNLRAGGRDLRVMDQNRGVVDLDADVIAVGPLDALRVTGDATMKGGYLALKQFRKDLLRVKAPGELSFFAVYDTAASDGDSLRVVKARAVPRKVAIIADLDIVIDRGNYYRNRPDANTEFYTGRGEVVRAHIDQRSSDQWAIGFVRIGEGAAYFRTRPFVPARGTLTFGPHTGAVGIVQQVGERLLWEPNRGWLPLQLMTGGTSTGPAIGLESGSLFPMRGRELNGYLTLGRASTSLLQQSGSSLSGSESWSGQLTGESGALARRQQAATALGVVLHDIGTGTTKEYGLDAFSMSPADVPTELVFGKTGGVRGALVEGGRYLTPSRYVAGQMRITSGIPGVRLAQRFGTIYRLDVGIEPRFLFRGQRELGITHPTVRTGVFGAFLTRVWDY